MAWGVLLFAGLLEVGRAVGSKYTEGFARLWPTLGTAVALVASPALPGIASRTVPPGTAYAVWTEIGTLGTAILGIVLFHESASPVRWVCIALVVAGILGMQLASSA